MVRNFVVRKEKVINIATLWTNRNQNSWLLLQHYITNINNGSCLGVQHAAQRRSAGQHGAQQISVKQSYHVLWLGPQ